jgi:acetyl-CoA carboxylase carboxyl transferase subunit alpha
VCAAALKMTSPDLLQLGLVDEVIPEPPGGAHHSWDTAAEAVKTAVLRQIAELRKLPIDDLRERRYAKFRAFGEFTEAA